MGLKEGTPQCKYVIHEKDSHNCCIKILNHTGPHVTIDGMSYYES